MTTLNIRKFAEEFALKKWPVPTNGVDNNESFRKGFVEGFVYQYTSPMTLPGDKNWTSKMHFDSGRTSLELAGYVADCIVDLMCGENISYRDKMVEYINDDLEYPDSAFGWGLDEEPLTVLEMANVVIDWCCSQTADIIYDYLPEDHRDMDFIEECMFCLSISERLNMFFDPDFAQARCAKFVK